MIGRLAPMTTAFLALSLISGCAARTAATDEARFSVSFETVTDEGEPLAGVTLTVGQRAIGTTPESGRLRETVSGNEGQTLVVSSVCPAGFVSDERPSPLRLTHTRKMGTGEPEALQFRATCARRARDVVVVVRAERGAGLPVRVDGKAIGTTSAEGLLHAVFQVDREVRTLGVSLDTTARRELRPESPSRTFDLAGRDTVIVVDQSFTALSTSRPRAAAPKPRHVPYRVD